MTKPLIGALVALLLVLAPQVAAGPAPPFPFTTYADVIVTQMSPFGCPGSDEVMAFVLTPELDGGVRFAVFSAAVRDVFIRYEGTTPTHVYLTEGSASGPIRVREAMTADEFAARFGQGPCSYLISVGVHGGPIPGAV